MVIEAEQSTEALPAYDQSRAVEVGERQDDLAAQALVVAFLVMWQKLDRGDSGRLAVIKAQQAAEALPAYDRSGAGCEWRAAR